MAYNFEYPYTDIDRANSDWLLNRMKTLLEEWELFTVFNEVKYADPLQWNITTQYEKNTIVQTDDGSTYLSKKPVPKGINITNNEYWLKVADFNSGIQTIKEGITNAIESGLPTTATANRIQYELVWLGNQLVYCTEDIPINTLYVIGENCELCDVDDRIRWIFDLIATETENRISKDEELEDSISDEEDARILADNNLGTRIDGVESDIDTLTINLANEVTNRTNADNTLQANISAEATARANGDNSINTKIGDLSSLTTPVKSSVVNAINSLKTVVDTKTAPKHYLQAGEETRYYLDCVNGNDNNNGKTSSTAWKTMDKLLNEANTSSTDVRCYIIRGGYYDITNWILNGVILHIEAQVNGVILRTTTTQHGWVIYNSHINILGNGDGGRITITDLNETNRKSHWENSAITCQYVNFAKMWEYYGGYGYFNHCGFVSELLLHGANVCCDTCTFSNAVAGAEPLQIDRSTVLTLLGSATFNLNNLSAQALINGFGGVVNIRCNASVTGGTPSKAIHLRGGSLNIDEHSTDASAKYLSNWKNAGGVLVEGGGVNSRIWNHGGKLVLTAYNGSQFEVGATSV